MIIVEHGIPVLPHRFVAVAAYSLGHGMGTAFVSDVELLERFGRSGVSTRLGLAAGAHGRCNPCVSRSTSVWSMPDLMAWYVSKKLITETDIPNTIHVV